MFLRLWQTICQLYSVKARAGRAEWMIMLLLSSLIPLVGIPATLRRLNDMNRSAWWALLLFALPIMLAVTFIPIRFMGKQPEQWKMIMATPTLIAVVLTFATFGWMAFAKSAPANQWGEPAEQ